MTIQTQAWIWNHSSASGADKLVQLALANCGSYGDDPTVVLLPGLPGGMGDTLTRATGMSLSEIYGSLDALEASREIHLAWSPDRTTCICIFEAFRLNRAGRSL